MTETLDTQLEAVGYEYLTDRQGIVSPELSDRQTLEAIERLRPFHPTNGAGFIARNADQTFGIVLEGAEYPYEATKQDVDGDWYEGRLVNGEFLDAGAFPTLEEIERHIAVEVTEINRRYPGLDAGSFRGDDTFDGHVTLLAFVPESSPYITRTTEIGEALSEVWRENMLPKTVALAP